MKYLLILIFLINTLYGYNKFLETKSVYKESKLSWLDLRNKNLVAQKYDYSCGSASLSTIFKYFYNKDISEIDIMESIHKNNETLKESDGFVMFSFLDLANVAKENDFKSFSVELDFETLKKLKIPAIIHLIIRKEAHFTVFKAIDKNYIYLADPNFGNIKIPLEKFQEMFTTNNDKGKILLIIPKNEMPLNFAFMNIEKSDTKLTDIFSKNKILIKEIRKR